MKKITFVISEVKLHEHLSVMALSASLKNSGHETSLVFIQNDPLNKNKILKALKNENPDFIAFSFMSGVKNQYFDLGTYIKRHMDIPIIIGGPAATFDQSLSNIKDNPFDAVCIGEGDLSIIEFVNKYNQGKNLTAINNFIIESGNGNQLKGDLLNLVEPLNQLPFPDRKILYDKDDFLRNSKIKMFISGRGCPYQCTYCFNHKYNSMYKGKGKIIRHKSVDYFLEEICKTKKEYPLEGIIFEDDIFIIDKEWLSEFAEKYPKRIGLPYMCYVRPNLVTKELARLLKVSGCYSVRVAIECGNEVLRNKILKRNLSNEQILKSCQILQDENIKIGTINILGLPTETITNMRETLELNRACKPDHVSANMFIPLPGVDLTLFAVQKGLLDEEFNSPKSTHHISDMKYPDDVKRFLYPFKALFPLMVLKKNIETITPLLMKLPGPLLKMIDSGYRLYRNAKFYPPVRFSIREKWEALRRFLTIVSR
ncbi:MAG: radical SAM protein [Candidatus Brocadiaceae bacterium]|nr:radical SAM protein [Candidatus Brocadiaceae bacterium]